MTWIADAGIAGIALWSAFILTGIAAGSLFAKWNAPEAGGSRRDEQLLVVAATAAVIAWCANAGSLIGSSSRNPLYNAFVPIPVEPGFRLTVLWATLPGATLSVATVLLIWNALDGAPRSTARTRLLALRAGIALVASGIALWFAPPPNVYASKIPAFVQSAPAALAPLFALAAAIMLAEGCGVRIAGAVSARSRFSIAWVLATLAVAAEQLARSALGIGPRDPVVFGSAASGLVLWLVTSATLHRRIQATLFGIPAPARNAGAARLAHAGAILVGVSFAAHAFATRETLSLAPGASLAVTDAFRRSWHLANQGISRFDTDDDADVLSAALQVQHPSGKTGLLTPEIRDHHGPHGELLENSVSRRVSTGAIFQTLRVLLVGADSLDVAHVRITFLPLPILWPIGMALLLLAPLIGSSRDPSPR